MAGGETQTPVQKRPRFTENDMEIIWDKVEALVAEKIRIMGGGVREVEKQAARQEAKREAFEWARANNIGSWPS